MTHLGADAEEALENATLALFAELGWETVNGYHEVTSETPDAGTGGPYLGRAARYEVVLRPRLEAALTRLNPTLPSEALHQAVVELTRDRSAMTLVHANREVYALLKDGVPVTYRDAGGEERVERVNGSTSARGRRSTARGKRASCRWRRWCGARANRSASWTSSRISSFTRRSGAA